MFSGSPARHLATLFRSALHGAHLVHAAGICALLSGCSDPSSDGRLSVELASADALVVQFGCAAQCPQATLSLTINYPSTVFNPADTIQLLQYRVDYDVAGSRLELPYYAEPLSLVIKPEESMTLTLTAAGDAQRRALDEGLGTGSASASADLQLAGYDWDNRQVIVRADFDVQLRREEAETQGSRDDNTSP